MSLGSPRSSIHGLRIRITSYHHTGAIDMIIIYLQSECIEKYNFKLYSKYDREHDFDVIRG